MSDNGINRINDHMHYSNSKLRRTVIAGALSLTLAKHDSNWQY